MDEFNALSNAAGKAFAFLTLGFLAANLTETGSARRASRLRKLTFIGALSMLFLLAASIEVSQVYLTPYIGDASDVILYAVAGGCGWLLRERIYLKKTQTPVSEQQPQPTQTQR